MPPASRANESEGKLMCLHCGWQYDPKIAALKYTNYVEGKVPTHDYPPFCRSVCPGSGGVAYDANTIKDQRKNKDN